MEEEGRIRWPIELPETSGRIRFCIVPEFPPEDSRSKIERSADGSPGSYRVTCVLGVPGARIYHENLHLTELMESGDSLLEVPQEYRPNEGEPSHSLNLMIAERACPIFLFLNSKGRIGYARLSLEAAGFLDAERTTYDIVSSLLSYFSYQYDVAIEIAGQVLIEERTGVIMWVFGVAGRRKTATLPGAGYHVEDKDRRLLAAYREGMNSTNVFYQVLAFYKTIEGIRNLRNSRIEKAKAEGREIPRMPSEEFPSTLEELYQVPPSDRKHVEPYLGKKFTAVRDELREIIRNAVAHLDPQRDVLDNDKFDDVMVCAKTMPVLRYMARLMLSSEIPIIRFTGEGPTFYDSNVSQH